VLFPFLFFSFLLHFFFFFSKVKQSNIFFSFLFFYNFFFLAKENKVPCMVDEKLVSLFNKHEEETTRVPPGFSLIFNFVTKHIGDHVLGP
jgi:hypothetical protein